MPINRQYAGVSSSEAAMFNRQGRLPKLGLAPARAQAAMTPRADHLTVWRPTTPTPDVDPGMMRGSGSAPGSGSLFSPPPYNQPPASPQHQPGMPTLSPPYHQSRTTGPASPGTPALPGFIPAMQETMGMLPINQFQPAPTPDTPDPYQGLGLAERAFMGEQGNLPAPNRSGMMSYQQRQAVMGDLEHSMNGRLRGAGAELADQNQFNQNRVLPPYDPLANPISGPGMYGQHLRDKGPVDNAAAQQIFSSSGYMPSRTPGGAYGQPGPNAYAAGDQVLKDIARDQGIAARGGQREAMLADMNRRPRSGAVAAAQKPSGPLPVDPAGAARAEALLTSKGYGRNGNSFVGPTSGPQFEASQKAKEVFDARRGGVEARRQAYEQRTADNAKFRKDNVYAKAVTRSEARRARRGQFTPGEQLDRAAPAQYQARRAAEANSQAQADALAGRLGLAKSEMEARERMSTDRNATLERIAGAKNEAEFGAKPTPPPITAAPKVSPAGNALIREEAAKGNVDGIRQQLVKEGVTSKVEQDRVIAEVTGQATGEEAPSTFQNISEGMARGLGLSAITPGQAPNRAARPGAIKHGKPGAVNPLKRRVAFEDLVPQPGDNPAQKKAREELAKKYSGMRAQLRSAGKL
jgi:hypothetical protein